MKKLFLCEYCTKTFYNEEECIKHEEKCGNPQKVKLMKVSLSFNMLDAEYFDHEAIVYTNAIELNNCKFRLSNDDEYITKIQLDKIKEGTSIGSCIIYLEIYSKKLDEKYHFKILHEYLKNKINDLRKKVDFELNNDPFKSFNSKCNGIYKESYKIIEVME